MRSTDQDNNDGSQKDVNVDDQLVTKSRGKKQKRRKTIVQRKEEKKVEEEHMQEKVNLDKSWIHANRLSYQYEEGVDKFIEFAKKNAEPGNPNRMFCPCMKRFNMKLQDAKEMKYHLFAKGFNPSYTRWIWHGESLRSADSGNGGLQKDHIADAESVASS